MQDLQYIEIETGETRPQPSSGFMALVRAATTSSP
ncbi:hypothetical protein HP15_1716 [Marinobacter adhaerens HP15]|uniref:Uncharacterized protein n=1 Tax=Marinobacter adhaerens (strain DSM 23420 / HP15) TaxID=225937 RepID=E4PN31_MARAH|nr:hypothetical protein HP15_1716 [Marinobacter adhaerens HP15]